MCPADGRLPLDQPGVSTACSTCPECLPPPLSVPTSTAKGQRTSPRRKLHLTSVAHPPSPPSLPPPTLGYLSKRGGDWPRAGQLLKRAGYAGWPGGCCWGRTPRPQPGSLGHSFPMSCPCVRASDGKGVAGMMTPTLPCANHGLSRDQMGPRQTRPRPQSRGRGQGPAGRGRVQGHSLLTPSVWTPRASSGMYFAEPLAFRTLFIIIIIK